MYRFMRLILTEHSAKVSGPELARRTKTDTASYSTQNRGSKSDPLDLQGGRTSERSGGLVQ